MGNLDGLREMGGQKEILEIGFMRKEKCLFVRRVDTRIARKYLHRSVHSTNP